MKPKCPEWLRSAIFYEIYPQSFLDTNGDGIGDLAGITRKLDYVKSVGCNAIWINPCFESPFADAGYDVADYYKIAPRYGTNADMKRLFREAHGKGIRIIMDFVPGHTSIEHPWFKESCKATPNKYSNWYIWTDCCWTAPGQLPHLKGYAQRAGSFALNFFWSQPALNYGFAKPDPKQKWQLPTDHPDVLAMKAEMAKVMRFWLDMGADGFRVDMAGSLVKGDKDFKCTKAHWRQVRAMFDKDYPDAALVAEWSNPQRSLDAGFHADFVLPFVPHFASLLRKRGEVERYFDKCGKGDAATFMVPYMEHYRKTRSKGYIANITGNHDAFRISQGRTPREIELCFAFVMTMPGIPFIYYGDEIGMRNQEELHSHEGGYERTAARTPMQWRPGLNAGFSSAPARKLYLPVDRNPGCPNVEEQEKSPKSLLNRVRALAALRNRLPALGADGEFIPLFAKKGCYPLVYLRKLGKQRVLVAINPCVKKATAEFSGKGLSAPGALERGDGVQLSRHGAKLKIDMKGVSYGVFVL
jgi:maltose alpha-D-glucosyltransferase/alpha-amylase